MLIHRVHSRTCCSSTMTSVAIFTTILFVAELVGSFTQFVMSFNQKGVSFNTREIGQNTRRYAKDRPTTRKIGPNARKIELLHVMISSSSTMTSAAIFITILFVAVDMGWCDHDPSPMAYWNKMFPDLAMPNPVLQSLPKMQQDDIGAKTMFEPKHFVLPQAYRAAVRDDEAVANRAFFLQKNLVLDSKTQIYVPQGDCKVDPVPPSLLAPDNVKWSYLNDILPTYVIHPDSKMADVLKITLKRCESRNAVNSRIQACLGPLEALVNLVTSTFRSNVMA